jgi:hypothetical protein
MTNNTSIVTADRKTHLKIVVVSLMASIAVVAVGISAQLAPPEAASTHIQTPIKVGPSMIATGQQTTQIR